MAELTLILESRPRRWDLDELEITAESSPEDIKDTLSQKIDGEIMYPHYGYPGGGENWWALLDNRQRDD